MSFSNSENSCTPLNFDKAIWLLLISAFFGKSWVVCHQTPEILAFDELLTNFGLLYTDFDFKYEDSENLKADHTDAIIFNLHQIKHRAFFLGHSVLGFFQSIRLKFSLPSFCSL